MWKLKLSIHKGNTSVQSYTPTAEEIRLQKQAADYGDAVAPNALWLNNTARDVLQDSYGTVQVDYNALNQGAQQQLLAAQQGVAGLANGEIPVQYQQNMENSIRSGVQNTMGNIVNSLGQRGVLNSSVTNQAMNDVSKNVSDTMAQQYSNNLSSLNGLYGQQASLAANGITTAAAAQEAAQQPALSLWNASLGLNGANTSALGAVAGQGTTTTKTSGSGGLFGSILGAGASLGAAAISCFPAGSMVLMGGGEDKPIEDIKIGDNVWGLDANKAVIINKVIGVQEPVEQPVYKITAVDKLGNTNSVETTLTQPLMKENGEYICVGIMKINTELLGAGKVIAIQYVGEKQVYDLKTTGQNNYFVNGFIAYGRIAGEE